jgi:hypothetical protein
MHTQHAHKTQGIRRRELLKAGRIRMGRPSVSLTRRGREGRWGIAGVQRHARRRVPGINAMATRRAARPTSRRASAKEMARRQQGLSWTVVGLLKARRGVLGDPTGPPPPLHPPQHDALALGESLAFGLPCDLCRQDVPSVPPDLLRGDVDDVRQRFQHLRPRI